MRVHSLRQVKCPRVCSAGVVSVERRALSFATVSSCVASSLFSLAPDQIMAMLLIVAMLIDAPKLSLQGLGAKMLCSLRSHHICSRRSFGTVCMLMVKEKTVFFAKDSQSFLSVLMINALSKTGSPLADVMQDPHSPRLHFLGGCPKLSDCPVDEDGVA